jgi:hypothetical protein
MFLCIHHKWRAPSHAGWAICQTVTAIAVIVAMVLIGRTSRRPSHLCGKSRIRVFEILPIQSLGAELWMETNRDRTD